MLKQYTGFEAGDLIMKVSDLRDILFKALLILDRDMDSYGFGREYDRIVDVIEVAIPLLGQDEWAENCKARLPNIMRHLEEHK